METQSSPIWVVIPAAGFGQRMGSALPKQYLTIDDKTLIEHTLDCFISHQQIAGIVVVISSEDSYWQTLNIKSNVKPILTTLGGLDRCDSVSQGLKYLSTAQNVSDDAWVMVHDAARPCLLKNDIDSLLALRDSDCVGGLLASPVRDTMKRSYNDKSNQFMRVSKTESRQDLWHALTPQMFRLGELTNALEQAEEAENITDESSAMELMGLKPVIVKGSHNNIKVTHPSDLDLASFLIQYKSKPG